MEFNKNINANLKPDGTASAPQGALISGKDSMGDQQDVLVGTDGKLQIDAIVTPSGTQDINLKQVGGASISIGQQLAAESLPVILPSATITTLTPPAAITGFATEAKQDTIISHVDGLEGLLTTIDADTGAMATDLASIETLLTTIEGNQLPDGHNVAISGTPSVDVMEWGNVGVTAAASLADGATNPTSPIVGAASLLWNGATLDRQRGVHGGTALTSAARTATTNSSLITNYNARGIMVFLNVTAMGASSTLNVLIFGADPTTANGVNLNDYTGKAVSTTGTFAYELYPGSSGAVGGTSGVMSRTAATLSRTILLQVLHTNANSCTYSLGYIFIP